MKISENESDMYTTVSHNLMFIINCIVLSTTTMSLSVLELMM